jgi:hypothetical protein
VDHEIDFASPDADIVGTTSGLADTGGMKRFLDEVVSDDRFRAGSTFLSDHSALDFSGLTPTDIRDISAILSRLNEQHHFGPVATVVPNAFAFGYARMGQTLVESALRDRIFYSREDAIDWLRTAASQR